MAPAPDFYGTSTRNGLSGGTRWGVLVDVDLYFPAKHLESSAGEYDDQDFWRRLDPRSARAKEWAATISLTQPVDAWADKDGRVTFDDGHHRAMAGKILDVLIPVRIRSRLRPEVWEWYYAMLMQGKSPWEINPGYSENLQTLYDATHRAGGKGLAAGSKGRGGGGGAGPAPDFYGASPRIVQVDVRKLYAPLWKVKQTAQEVDKGDVSRSNAHPLHLKALGGGRYYVIDGNHRVLEALLAGRKTLPARIGYPGPVPGGVNDLARHADAVVETGRASKAGRAGKAGRSSGASKRRVGRAGRAGRADGSARASGMTVVADEGISPAVAMRAKDALDREILLRGENALAHAAARYVARLVKVRDDRAGARYEFVLQAKGGKRVKDDLGRERSAVYPIPTSARGQDPHDLYKQIRAEEGLAYRGMSWEAWQHAQRTGSIASSGEMNLGEEQVGLTFYTADPAMATSYGGSFSGWHYLPAHGRPGVVVAVPRKGLLSHQDAPKAVPSGELAARSPIALSEVRRVWFLVPYEVRDGTLEIEENKYTGRIFEGSRMSPSSYCFIVAGRVSKR